MVKSIYLVKRQQQAKNSPQKSYNKVLVGLIKSPFFYRLFRTFFVEQREKWGHEHKPLGGWTLPPAPPHLFLMSRTVS